MNLPICVGMPLLSHHGEIGETHFGKTIETGPNALGVIVSIDEKTADNPISVVFSHGIIAALSAAEIYDRQNYALDVSLPPGFDSQAILNWGEVEPDDHDQYRIYARNLLLANFEMPTYVAEDAKISTQEFEVKLFGYVYDDSAAPENQATGNKKLDARNHIGMDGVCIYPTGKRQVGISENGTLGYWIELAIELDKSSLENIDPGTVLKLKPASGYPHKRATATYSSQEDEEAAFQQLQKLWNQVAEVLRLKSSGTTIIYKNGTLVMGVLNGSLTMLDSPDISSDQLTNSFNIFRIEDFEGVGKPDLDDMRVRLEQWLDEPTYGSINPVLVAECIANTYSDTSSDPFWRWDGKEV